MRQATYWIVAPVVCGAVLGVASLFVVSTDRKLELAVAVLGLVLGAQLELTRRLERRQARHDRAGRLLALVEELPDEMAVKVRENVRLLANAAKATREDRLYHRALHDRLAEQRDWLEALSKGIIEVESDETGLLTEWTAASRTSIRATGVAETDIRWWRSRPGRQFWEVNLAAMARKVRVQRVFIYDRMTPELAELAREQKAAGVDVYVVKMDQLRIDLRVDVTIVDDVRVHEVIFSSGGNAMAYRYSQEPSRAAQMVAKFERIVQLATPEAELGAPVES